MRLGQWRRKIITKILTLLTSEAPLYVYTLFRGYEEVEAANL